MTEEEKQAAAKLEKEKADADFEASLENLSDEEKTQKRAEREKGATKKATTEELLKKERERRIKAEQDLEATRTKARERWKKDHPDDEGENKPLTRDDLDVLLAEREDKVRKELYEIRAREMAIKLSENVSQAELTLEIWKNRTLAGSLEEQLEEAHAIATSKSLKVQNEELKRALLAKDGEVTDYANPQRKPPLGAEPKLNPTDQSALIGYVWDAPRGAFKKVIAGGRKIFYVSRDLKKRWTEDTPKK